MASLKTSVTVKSKSKSSSGVFGLKKSLEKLQKSRIKVGHFKEQGLHYSNLTYPELMGIYETANNPSGVMKNPRALFKFHISQGKYPPELEEVMNDFLDDAFNDKYVTYPINYLPDMGVVLRESYRKLFGKLNPPYMPASGSSDNPNLTPLVHLGDLKSEVAYKVSAGSTFSPAKSK